MENTNTKQTFFKYVTHNVLGMIGLSCYILADTFFIARGVGANGLTALNLAIPIYSFIHGTGLMIGMGGATRFAISKSKTVFTQAFYYVLIMASIFVSIGILLSGGLANLLGANADTYQMATTYLQVILCFSPMFMLNNLVICFVRNDDNPKLVMNAMLIGSFSNIILDYIFVFPLKMGMFGAALATGIAPIISLLILSMHFIKKRNSFQLYRLRPQPRTYLDISLIGVSSLVTELSSGIVIIVFNSIILRIKGNLGVAAYGIIANIALVVISIFIGIAQGVQPILSKNYGEQNKQNVKKVLNYGIVTVVTFALIIYGFFFLFSEPIVGVFNKEHDRELARIAVQGLRIYFTSFLFAGINILCCTYFSSIDKLRNAFIISILRGFIFIIPLAMILSSMYGMIGVWLTMTLTEFLVLILTVVLLKNINRRN
ncbi:MATE family efflux transporter [Anaerocolumna aminovalerica]|uniref:MATE family efflux transporter n=1 Tax=Anaerocolumna aminovalerica TaxID=1527 RepID=UPI000BE38C6A|nr:MATE family efflux transporter [Anaerocolumna aminovalerica]